MKKILCTVTGLKFMEIFTKNSAKCTIFQSNNCNNFSSLMQCTGQTVIVMMTRTVADMAQEMPGSTISELSSQGTDTRSTRSMPPVYLLVAFESNVLAAS
jgi:hypothetical protein